jgi:hypothetical protein
MPYGIHFVPLGILISTAESYFFGVNPFGYGVLSLSLHLANIFLVYYSIIQITKNKKISFLAAAFFAVNYPIREGVFWFASNTWIELCTFFVLLGLIQFNKFYITKKTGALISAFFLFFISVFFKEYSFMLIFISMFFLIYLYIKEKEKTYLLFISLSFMVLIFYSLFRLDILHTVNSSVITTFNFHLIYLIQWNALTLPAKTLGAILLPQGWILQMSTFIAHHIYTQLDIAQTPVFITVLFYDQLYIFFGFIFLLLSICLYIYLKKKSIAKVQHFTLLLYGISFYFIPIIFLSLNGYQYWIYSRYLYLPSAVYLIFIASTVGFIPIFKRANRLSSTVFCFCLIFILIHAYLNHVFLVGFINEGNYRLNIVQNVSKRLDFNKKQQIVYIKTSSGGYSNGNDIFGMGTSFGKELLIWNWFQNDNKEKIPRCLYSPEFLFKEPINDYKGCDGKGYGYFQDLTKLKQTLKKYHLSIKDVVALSYDKNSDTFIDIHSELEKKLY